MNVNVADVEIAPIELEIIYNALTAAAAEMDVTIWRTSRSTIVRELLDYSTAIFDRDGWNVAQAARIPSHLNSMSYFLTEILARHIPPDRWGPDDIVVSNDPYCGGQHLPDIVAFKAIFRNDHSVLFVSLHQWPFYPGTGGPGTSDEHTVNVPLSAGSGDAQRVSRCARPRRAGVVAGGRPVTPHPLAVRHRWPEGRCAGPLQETPRPATASTTAGSAAIAERLPSAWRPP